MRFLYTHHFQNAHQSLKNSRVRSALTMLGIAIGIASITAILSLSDGASKIVTNQVTALGGNIAVIRPGAPDDFSISVNQLQPSSKYSTSTITEADISSIKSIEHVASVAPIMVLSGSIKADSTAPTGSPIVATTPDFNKIVNFKFGQGQFLDNTIEERAAVIGAQLSVNVFGTEVSIGRKITIRGKEFTIVGVLKMINNPINYNLIDFDNAVIIDYEAGKSMNQNAAQIQQIDIMADSSTNLKKAVENIDKIMIKNHSNERDFSILTGNQVARPTSRVFSIIAGVTTAIATISLVVGGVGIMNIMLVTVAERTREIGIRKAVGASNSDIMWQFLIESLALSLGGGIAGYIIGYILAFIISTFLTFLPAFSWQIAVVTLVVSVFTGTIFGLYPAIRAARKDPIESLHRYN